MAHIHTEPGQHDHTVSAFIFRKVDGEHRTFLHMHRKLGTLMQIGGHIELDETPWGAMAHELEEESGYTLDELKLLQPVVRLQSISGAVVQPQPFLVNVHRIKADHFHDDMSYVFLAESEPVRRPQEGESDDIHWLSLAEIRALSKDEMFANVRDILEYLMNDLLGSDAWEPVAADVYSIDNPTE